MDTLVERGTPIDPDAAKAALASAWALKNECYAAWASEPQAAVKAARALADLHATAAKSQPAPTGALSELAALAQWTQGIAHLTQGEMAQAGEAFEAAAAHFRHIDQPHHAAQTQVPRIMALAMLGQHDAAVACAETTQQALLAHGDRLAAAKVSVNLSALHLRRGDYAQAVRHGREATVLFARAGDATHSVMADINLAAALAAQGDLDESERICARAAMRAQRRELPALLAMIEESKALMGLVRGRYREALAAFENARARYEALAMPQQLAIAEKQLADAYLELRLLPEALALFEQAQRNFHALDMPHEAAWAQAQQGRALAQLGRFKAAAQSLAQAAQAFASEGHGVGQASVAQARAELFLMQGDASAALAQAEAAEQGFLASKSADAACQAAAARADALLALGDLAQATRVFDRTQKEAQTLQLWGAQVRCWTGLGLAALQGPAPETALPALERAAAMFEDQRSALPGDDVRRAFLVDHLRPYQALLHLALLRHEREGGAASALNVLQRLDQFRARVLGERLANTAPADDSPQTQALRERLNWLARRSEQLRQDDDAAGVAQLAQELRSTEFRLLETARRARLAAASQSHGESERASTSGADISGLAAQMPARCALVAYGVSQGELFACIVTTGSIHVQRRLAAWADVQAACQAARFQIDTLRHGNPALQLHMPLLTARAQRCLARAHALLWAPLVPHLAACQQVIVVPHGELGAVPFAALFDGSHYLGQNLQLGMAASAWLAQQGLRQAPAAAASQRALALGESSLLPYAAKEAHAVAQHFALGQAKTGPAASLQTLQEHGREADVIHLACHAEFRADNPMFSALHLADGKLSVEAVQQLRLRAALVVLSACDSAGANVSAGDEALGLVQGFLTAGAGRVMSALWPVQDEATANFMQYFYGHLAAGATPAAALQAAQNKLMQTSPHPFFWAAFMLHGGV